MLMDYMIHISVYCMNCISQNLKFIIIVVNWIEEGEKENRLEKSWSDSTPPSIQTTYLNFTPKYSLNQKSIMLAQW